MSITSAPRRHRRLGGFVRHRARLRCRNRSVTNPHEPGPDRARQPGELAGRSLRRRRQREHQEKSEDHVGDFGVDATLAEECREPASQQAGDYRTEQLERARRHRDPEQQHRGRSAEVTGSWATDVGGIQAPRHAGEKAGQCERPRLVQGDVHACGVGGGLTAPNHRPPRPGLVRRWTRTSAKPRAATRSVNRK